MVLVKGDFPDEKRENRSGGIVICFMDYSEEK
jgi:hypothetical protein